MLALLLLPALVAAHFEIDEPKPRGFDEDKLGTGPCGGQDAVSRERTSFPISNGTIQLDMGHSRSNVQVNLALGNDAVDAAAFNISLVPLTQEMGLGKFCLAGLTIPSGIEVKDGQNATLQVITNGDPQGGLYNCADITFSSSAQPGPCTNGTGVSTKAYTGTSKNANMSTSSEEASSSPTASGSAGNDAATSRMSAIGLLTVMAGLTTWFV